MKVFCKKCKIALKSQKYNFKSKINKDGELQVATTRHGGSYFQESGKYP